MHCTYWLPLKTRRIARDLALMKHREAEMRDTNGMRVPGVSCACGFFYHSYSPVAFFFLRHQRLYLWQHPLHSRCTRRCRVVSYGWILEHLERCTWTKVMPETPMRSTHYIYIGPYSWGVTERHGSFAIATSHHGCRPVGYLSLITEPDFHPLQSRRMHACCTLAYSRWGAWWRSPPGKYSTWRGFSRPRSSSERRESGGERGGVVLH